MLCITICNYRIEDHCIVKDKRYQVESTRDLKYKHEDESQREFYKLSIQYICFLKFYEQPQIVLSFGLGCFRSKRPLTFNLILIILFIQILFYIIFWMCISVSLNGIKVEICNKLL